MRSLLLPTLALTCASLLGAACDKGKSDQARPSPAPSVAPAPKGEATPPAPTGPAPAASLPGTKYGAGVSIDDPALVVTVDDLLANPKAYEGKTVRVEGMVTDVCPKRGCWMDLAGSGPGKKVRFKVDDGVMTFPMEAKGSQAVTQGVVAVQTLSLEESKAYAEHQAKEYGAAYDPAAITEPMVVVRIDGTGAVVRDK